MSSAPPPWRLVPPRAAVWRMPEACCCAAGAPACLPRLACWVVCNEEPLFMGARERRDGLEEASESRPVKQSEGEALCGIGVSITADAQGRYVVRALRHDGPAGARHLGVARGGDVGVDAAVESLKRRVAGCKLVPLKPCQEPVGAAPHLRRRHVRLMIAAAALSVPQYGIVASHG